MGGGVHRSSNECRLKLHKAQRSRMIRAPTKIIFRSLWACYLVTERSKEKLCQLLEESG